SNPKRQGFGPTANCGVRAARFRLVYLINNDVALTPATLAPLAEHFRDSPVFAVTGNAYDFASGVLSGAGQRGRFRRGFLSVHSRFFFPSPAPQMEPLSTVYATGGSSLFDRDKFLALGGFEEMLAPYGWEDVELSLRAWKQGYEIRYEPRSAIWHQFSSTIGSRVSRRRATAVYDRNRLLTHWLHFDTSGQRIAHAAGVSVKLLTRSLCGRFEYWDSFARALSLKSCAKSKSRCHGQGSAASMILRLRCNPTRHSTRPAGWNAWPARGREILISSFLNCSISQRVARPND